MEEKKKRMQELVQLLSDAARAYYHEASEIMSNYEYDKLYDELVCLEKELDIVMAFSPTVNVGYEVLSELPKEQHEEPMLSLDKTKDRAAVRDFLGEKEALVSWKLDGLTIVLTYRDGGLFKAVTRGNGEIGEVITNNARTFKNLPLKIQYKGELILRGEAVIGYHDFDMINQQIEEVDAKYKNPRNLCSGSVRQLNNEITAKRNVCFFAFSLVKAGEVLFDNSRDGQMKWLQAQGFSVVEYHIVTKETLDDQIDYFADKIAANEYPSDGLVFLFDDIAYGKSLGRTSKFPRDSYAFKWVDEIKETRLLEIEWSPSRTGLINPVAIFESVELEGTTVSRASVHNLSIMEELELGIGDIVEVYKANMIIPQIADNLTRSGTCKAPAVCPVCGESTAIKKVSDAKTLYCMNPTCEVKQVKLFSLFVSRDALNIEGLSEATLEKFVQCGFIREFADIFRLERFEADIKTMEGFGEKSYENLIKNVNKARITSLAKVIYGLGIANIGLANAKLICKEFAYDLEEMLHADTTQLSKIDGVGEVIAQAFVAYFEIKEHVECFMRLLEELEITREEVNKVQQIFLGINFVITGSVEKFDNRGALKEQIEIRGGKVTGSVTSKTQYLINNDVNSASSKNKKARDLGVAIISEMDFIKMMEEA